jgi:hypothetical protein
LTILEELSLIQKELEEEIGNFDIVTNDGTKSLLIRNWKGIYFTITKPKSQVIVEDIQWIADGIKSRKKKQRYINNVDLKRRNGNGH